MTAACRRHLVLIAAVVAATACATDDGPGDGVDSEASREVPETAAPEPEEEDAIDRDVLAGDDPAQDPDTPVDELTFATCDGDGFTVGYPDSWTVADGEHGEPCAVFGPEGVGAADRADLSVPIQLYVDADAEFEDQPDATDAERSREPLTVDEQRAVRIEAITPGDGGEPEGVEVTTYRVELDDGGVLTATTSDLGDTDYSRDQDILARMMAEVRIG